MHFTHCTPGLIPYAARTVSTLQIYSVKIVGRDGKLKLSLHVYGIVAARDAVDYNRNILFCRSSADCQRINQEVCIMSIFSSNCYKGLCVEHLLCDKGLSYNYCVMFVV